MAKQCAVFISSTSEDLKEYRLAARDAVLAVGLHPEMMEYFAATGGPPLAECLDRVSTCEVAVAIVAERYGWVPPDQHGAGAKSITWLECECMAGSGKDVLAFFVDPKVKWPVESTEAFRLTDAMMKGAFTPELAEEVARNLAAARQFRTWLETGRTRATFTTPDDLRARIIQALHDWLNRHPECRSRSPQFDPRSYLLWLRDQTATIDIRGLGVGAGKAHSFPIEDLYIPLTTPREAGRGRDLHEIADREPMGLDEALEHRRLVIVGDPGSGKTTFLRRLTFALTGAALSADVNRETGFLERPAGLWRRATGRPAATQPFPLFIRIADLTKHVDLCRENNQTLLRRRRNIADLTKHVDLCRGQKEPDDPAWLSHFLASRSAMFGWGLAEEFFAGKLAGPDVIVLLDGLDEAPDPAQREQAARLFENATTQYRECRFVVTTRPQSYSGESLLRGFHEARIEPLAPEAVDTFLQRWCRGLYPESPRLAEEHHRELSEALRVAAIRTMTRNPVMLTALAVVHWNERRLPEQRADLYDSILVWLSRARESRPGREKAERSLTLLEVLALAMQNHPAGRQVRVPMQWAAEALQWEFGNAADPERLRQAGQFLEEESADSGIIVSRGGELQFWHLTFQEHLAARAIAGMMEPDQVELLFQEAKIYKPEWREVALLLAGVLFRQGKPKADGLVSAVLDRAGPSLAEQACAAGLLGAMVNDLRPFDYQPADRRYSDLMESVLGIFDREKAAGVEFQARLAAAEALGQAGDPRLARENWVRIGNLEIGRYPVTVAEYRKFVEDEGYQEERWWKAGGFDPQRSGPAGWEEQMEHRNRPVVNVSWYEAKAYCAWAGVRLLTEKEWERAARGMEGREYPWGNEEPDATRANYVETGPGDATPVGLYPAGRTPEGLDDMAGNVWEWVEDRYNKRSEPRVLRGGSWRLEAANLRAAERYGVVPGVRLNDIGFRVAREVSFP